MDFSTVYCNSSNVNISNLEIGIGESSINNYYCKNVISCNNSNPCMIKSDPYATIYFIKYSMNGSNVVIQSDHIQTHKVFAYVITQNELDSNNCTVLMSTQYCSILFKDNKTGYYAAFLGATIKGQFYQCDDFLRTNYANVKDNTNVPEFYVNTSDYSIVSGFGVMSYVSSISQSATYATTTGYTFLQPSSVVVNINDNNYPMYILTNYNGDNSYQPQRVSTNAHCLMNLMDVQLKKSSLPAPEESMLNKE